MSVESTSRLLALLAVATLALFVTACSGPETTRQEWNPTDPFYSRLESGEGTVVDWSGYTDGHRLGEESTFSLQVNNGGQDTWQGSYCIQLLDNQGVAATLTQGVFSVLPGQSWARPVLIRFPSDLPERDYGLALVIPGRLSSVTTIQVGKDSSTLAGSWPDPVCP